MDDVMHHFQALVHDPVVPVLDTLNYEGDDGLELLAMFFGIYYFSFDQERQ